MRLQNTFRSLSTVFIMAAISVSSIHATDNAPQLNLSEGDQNIIPNTLTDQIDQPGTAQFTPPQGWRFADSQALPNTVKVMVVGKGAHTFPPSINLGTETYSGTLKQYLKRIKDINNSRGAEWKDLGTIRTDAGTASLSQVELKNQWGNVKMMHAILLKNGIVYIMTAASLKDEFPRFYKEFFEAMRSLKINDSSHSAAASTP